MEFLLKDGNVIIADQSFIDLHYPDATPVIRAAPVVAAEVNAPILQKIAAVEAGQLRAMREFMLSGNKTGLQLIDDQIAELRAALVSEAAK